MKYTGVFLCTILLSTVPAQAAEQVCSGNECVQVAQNLGTINIGYTIEQHEKSLKEQLATQRKDLERLHQSEQVKRGNRGPVLRCRLRIR